jgi:hypothetical protein
LKRRCLKWARWPIWTPETHVMAKRRVRSQIEPIWLSPLKVKNCLDFLTCRWHETYYWKALDEGYNFALNLILIRGLHAKLWVPKVAGVSNLGISRLPLGNPRTKCYLDVGLVERCRVYYKGEGGGFPQVQVVVSLMSSSLPVARPSTKSVQIMH